MLSLRTLIVELWIFVFFVYPVAHVSQQYIFAIFCSKDMIAATMNHFEYSADWRRESDLIVSSVRLGLSIEHNQIQTYYNIISIEPNTTSNRFANKTWSGIAWWWLRAVLLFGTEVNCSLISSTWSCASMNVGWRDLLESAEDFSSVKAIACFHWGLLYCSLYILHISLRLGTASVTDI